MGPISPGQNNNKRVSQNQDDTFPQFTVVNRNNSRITKKIRKANSSIVSANDHDYIKVVQTIPNELDELDSDVGCVNTVVDPNGMETNDVYSDVPPSSSDVDFSTASINLDPSHVGNGSPIKVACPDKDSNMLSNDSKSLRNSYRYNDSDPAPYLVILDSSNHSGNIGNIHPMSLGRKLLNSKISGIIELKKIGRNKIKCIFDSAGNANLFLDSSFADHNRLSVYIPTNQIQRQGLIRNVDASIPESELFDELIIDFNILSVRRLKKRVTDDNGQSKFVPIPLIVVTFKGKCLPETVNLFFTKCQVEPYVRYPIQCFNCLRYGHSAKACRGKTRCPNCALDHKPESCPNAKCPCCVFCKAPHSSLSNDCAQKGIEFRISQYMAFENISYSEAKSIVSPPKLSTQFKQSSYAKSLSVTKDNFPLLPPKGNTLFREKFCVVPSPINNNLFQPSKSKSPSTIHYRHSATREPRDNSPRTTPVFTHKYYSQFNYQNQSPTSPIWNHRPLTTGETPVQLGVDGGVASHVPSKREIKDEVINFNEDEIISIFNKFKNDNLPISKLIPALHKILTKHKLIGVRSPYPEVNNNESDEEI